jgi:hypothetical protein
MILRGVRASLYFIYTKDVLGTLFPTQAPRSEFRQLTSRAEQVFRIRHIKVQTPQPACDNRVMDESGMMTRVKNLFRIRRPNVSAMSWRWNIPLDRGIEKND